LVADNQYSALGLMLIATLARVQYLIHPFGKDADDELVIEELDAQNLNSEIEIEMGDLGEVVSREEISKVGVDDEDENEKMQEDTEVEVVAKKPVKRRKVEKVKEEVGKKEENVGVDEKPAKKAKKKRKKGGDAFDDLFAGLL